MPKEALAYIPKATWREGRAPGNCGARPSKHPITATAREYFSGDSAQRADQVVGQRRSERRPNLSDRRPPLAVGIYGVAAS
jgi:hypothetical protein